MPAQPSDARHLTDRQDDDQVASELEFGPIVSADWLLAHLGEEGLLVVDARPLEAYSLGHIAGAVDLDLYVLKLSSSDPTAIQQFQERAREALEAAGITPTTRIVFYEDVSGTSAARGVWLLDYLGLGNGAILDGGLSAWNAVGGQITTESATAVASTLSISPRPELLATADEIVAAGRGDRPPMQIIDTRSDLERLAGTIPGSVSLEWINTLNPDGSFRPLDELRALYEQSGIHPTAETVTFCASGFRAAHAYVVLKALGSRNVRNYAPSWGEWGQRDELPVAHPGLRTQD